MTDFNHSIYVQEKVKDYADSYLQRNKIKYRIVVNSNSEIVEIKAQEKYAKMLDNLEKRCYNKFNKLKGEA